MQNPYSVGEALTLEPYGTGSKTKGPRHAFVGREEILTELEAIIDDPSDNARVVCGQRRIGKTSILQQFRRRLEAHPKYRGVFIDVQHCGSKKPRETIEEIAVIIAHELEVDVPDLDESPFDTFINWLSGLSDRVGSGLALLFDEFDVIHGQQPVLESLRTLVARKDRRLAYVYTIGRTIGSLTDHAVGLFKDLKNIKVSLLAPDEIEQLVDLSNDALVWTAGARSAIKEEAGGHGYLTQHICSLLWKEFADHPRDESIIEARHVHSAIPQALQNAQIGLEWIWRGLNEPCQLVASLMAEQNRPRFSRDDVRSLLEAHGIAVIPELRAAPEYMVDWDVFGQEKDNQSDFYRFRVPVFAMWVRRKYPFDDVLPLVDRASFRAVVEYRKVVDGLVDDPIATLRGVLKLNPNYIEATRLLIGKLVDHGDHQDAVDVARKLYERRTDDMARPLLVDALMSRAQMLDGQEAIEVLEEVVELDPTVRDTLTTRILQHALECERRGDWRTALSLYRKLENEAHFEQALEDNVIGKLSYRSMKRVYLSAWLASIALLLVAVGLYILAEIEQHDRTRQLLLEAESRHDGQLMEVRAAHRKTIEENARQHRRSLKRVGIEPIMRKALDNILYPDTLQDLIEKTARGEETPEAKRQREDKLLGQIRNEFLQVLTGGPVPESVPSNLHLEQFIVRGARIDPGKWYDAKLSVYTRQNAAQPVGKIRFVSGDLNQPSGAPLTQCMARHDVDWRAMTCEETRSEVRGETQFRVVCDNSHWKRPSSGDIAREVACLTLYKAEKPEPFLMWQLPSDYWCDAKATTLHVATSGTSFDAYAPLVIPAYEVEDRASPEDIRRRRYFAPPTNWVKLARDSTGEERFRRYFEATEKFGSEAYRKRLRETRASFGMYERDPDTGMPILESAIPRELTFFTFSKSQGALQSELLRQEACGTRFGPSVISYLMLSLRHGAISWYMHESYDESQEIQDYQRVAWSMEGEVPVTLYRYINSEKSGFAETLKELQSALTSPRWKNPSYLKNRAGYERVDASRELEPLRVEIAGTEYRYFAEFARYDYRGPNPDQEETQALKHLGALAEKLAKGRKSRDYQAKDKGVDALLSDILQLQNSGLKPKLLFVVIEEGEDSYMFRYPAYNVPPVAFNHRERPWWTAAFHNATSASLNELFPGDTLPNCGMVPIYRGIKGGKIRTFWCKLTDDSNRQALLGIDFEFDTDSIPPGL